MALPALAGAAISGAASSAFSATLSKIGNVLFEPSMDDKGEGQSKSKVKSTSKSIASSLQSNNQILEEILSTLQQSLAIQQEAVKESRAEIVSRFKGQFDKSKATDVSVGKKIAASPASGGMSTAKKLGLAATGISAVAGAFGAANAGEIFDEVGLSERISAAIGQIVEVATFGLVDNERIAKNINNFFDNMVERFNAGFKYVQDVLGVKLTGDQSIFQTIGAKISKSIEEMKQSEMFKELGSLFDSVKNLDAEGTKKSIDNISNLISSFFQKLINKVTSAILGISIPSNKANNLIGIGGRSIGNILGFGTIETKQDAAQAELDKAQQQYDKFKEDTPLYRRLNPFGDEEAEERRLRENLRQAQEKYDSLEEQGIGGMKADDLFGTGELPKRIPDAGDNVNPILNNNKGNEFKKEMQIQDSLQEGQSSSGATNVSNYAVANNVVNNKTITSQNVRPRVNESAYTMYLEKNTVFG